MLASYAPHTIVVEGNLFYTNLCFISCGDNPVRGRRPPRPAEMFCLTAVGLTQQRRAIDTGCSG